MEVDRFPVPRGGQRKQNLINTGCSMGHIWRSKLDVVQLVTKSASQREGPRGRRKKAGLEDRRGPGRLCAQGDSS